MTEGGASQTTERSQERSRAMSGPAYAPYAPLNAPKDIAKDVWIVDGPEIRFGAPGFKLAHPTRMTVVRLPGGGLWLHSPTAPTESLGRELERLGPVRCLIAPNNFHYSWVSQWKTLFPQAHVWGVSGLPRRIERTLAPLQMLRDEPDPAWASVIDQLLVRGNMFGEAVFFHLPTRTLILTDLIENFESSRVRRPSVRRLLRWAGVADQDGRRPLDMGLAFLFRRRVLRAAVERMVSWNPERVILAHGKWFPTSGATELRRVFRWALHP